MAGKPSSGGEHPAIADRAVIEKATKGQLLVAVIRQRMDAGGRVLTHRIQQIRTDAPEPRIAKAPKILLKHANRPPTKVRCHRITVQRSTESIRSCANPVAPAGRGRLPRATGARPIGASWMTADAEAAMANPTPAADQPARHRRPASPETLRLYAADWAAFEDWCRGRALATLPADPATVAAFLTAGADTLGAGGLGRRAAAIAARHRQVGLASPAADPAVTAILHAAHRSASPRRPAVSAAPRWSASTSSISASPRRRPNFVHATPAPAARSRLSSTAVPASPFARCRRCATGWTAPTRGSDRCSGKSTAGAQLSIAASAPTRSAGSSPAAPRTAAAGRARRRPHEPPHRRQGETSRRRAGDAGGRRPAGLAAHPAKD